MEISTLYQIFNQCNGVTTDSRHCPKGSLFIALKGDTFNGNVFAAKALESGCAYAVIDEAEYLVPGDDRYLLTDNCLLTLQRLARHHRRQLGTRIIGITILACLSPCSASSPSTNWPSSRWVPAIQATSVSWWR